MPLAPRSEPIGGRRSSSAGGGEAEAASKEGEGQEGEEEEEDGAVPQVLPQEDAGSAARDLRAGLRYNARTSGSSWAAGLWGFAGRSRFPTRILGFGGSDLGFGFWAAAGFGSGGLF